MPGHMGVVSNPRVAKQIRQLLRHQDPDLFQRTTQFQDPHIQAWLCPLDAVPVEVQLVLREGGGGRGGREGGGLEHRQF